MTRALRDDLILAALVALAITLIVLFGPTPEPPRPALWQWPEASSGGRCCDGV